MIINYYSFFKSCNVVPVLFYFLFFSFKNHKQWWEQATGKCLADDHVVTKDFEDNSAILEHPKHEEKISGNSATIENFSVEEEQNLSPKRIKVDIALNDGELSVNQPELLKDKSCMEEIRKQSSDDEDFMNNISEDDTEASITNKEIEEVMQDVVRKRC